LFAWARGQGIAPDNMICTGDIVAYGADAAATVDLVRATGVHCLMGNVEERLAARAGDCGCGFIPNSACDLLAARWYAYADGAIDNAARAWMAALPRRMTFTMAGWRLAVVHGAASAISRFVFASTPEAVKRAEIGLSGADGVIGGHSGLPFSQVRGDRLWHNAGAIGLPANDGTARVWFSTLTVDPADGAAIRIGKDFDAPLPPGIAAAFGVVT
jgi:predicted phosphodiesterase